MDIAAYLEQVRNAYASGQATEHSYRPALTALFESIDPKLTVINEPKKSEAGIRVGASEHQTIRGTEGSGHAAVGGFNSTS